MINPVLLYFVCGLVTYLAYYHIINASHDDVKALYADVPPSFHFVTCVVMWPVVFGTIIYILSRVFKEVYIDGIVKLVGTELYAIKLRYILWRNKVWYLQKFRTLVLHFKDKRREVLFGLIKKKGIYWTVSMSSMNNMVHGRAFTRIGAVLNLIDKILGQTLGQVDFLVMVDTSLTFIANTETQSVHMVTVDVEKMLDSSKVISMLAEHKNQGK